MANERPGTTDKLILDALRTQEDVRRLARQARKLFRGRLRKAATRWAIAKFLVEQSFANLGLLLYAFLAVVGMVYVWAFYNHFDIAILDFYETPDFLLSAASGLGVMIVGIFAVVLVLGLLLATYGLSATQGAYREFHSLYEEVKYVRRARGYLTLAFAGGFCALVLPFVLAGVVGWKWATVKASKPEPVRVTLRSNSADAGALPATGATALPAAERTILVGTTNRFHFFYQCKGPEGALDCKDGEPFIVGTDNVAAIAYDRKTKVKSTKSDVASAIDSLAGAVSGLRMDTKIEIDSVEANLDTKNLTEAISSLGTVENPLNVKAGLSPTAVTVDTKDLPGAIDRLASAVNPINVEAKLTPPEVTLKSVVDPAELTLRAVVDPSELTVKAELDPSELTVRAELDPSELIVKAEFPDGIIPVHSHSQDRPFIIVPNGTESAVPVYVVPFDALSPLTTSDKGIYIPRRTRDWLREFYRSLSACGKPSVTVTGYASRRGFGDPQHESIWQTVLEKDDPLGERMNCGLANLRALAVTSALVGSTTGDRDSLVAGAKDELDANCEAPQACGLQEECRPEQCGDEQECGPQQECCCLHRKAENVRSKLHALCQPSLELHHKGAATEPPVHVQTWGENDTWSWVDENDPSRLLSRSVHIAVDPDPKQPACPQLSISGVSRTDAPMDNATQSQANTDAGAQ